MVPKFMGTIKCSVFRALARKGEHSLPINFGSDALGGFPLVAQIASDLIRPDGRIKP